MNKLSLTCLCLCLSIPAMLLASLAVPLTSVSGQTPLPQGHQVYIPMVPVAPEKLEQQWLGSLGGNASFFSVSENLAFLSIPGKLQLVDVSDPNQPAFLSEISLPGNPIQITVHDGYAYLAMGYLGMAILDIHSPETPAIAAILPLTGNTAHLLLSGNLAYLSNSLGLYTVDISQPQNPLILSHNDIVANWSMFLHDKLLVVGSSLNIFDLSTPSDPTQISNFDPGEWSLGGWVWLDIYNDRAYTATYGCGMHGCDYGIDVFDLSDPYHPDRIDYIDTNDWAPGIEFNHDLLYIADGWLLKTYQILSDGSYSLRSTLDVPDGVGWMYYENNRLYITSSNSIEVIDVSDPDDPDTTGKFTPQIPCGLIQPALPLIYCSYYIHTVDKEAFGLEIIDMSDPDNAEWIGAYETPVAPFLVNQVYLDGSRLYLSSRTSVNTRYGPTVEFLIYDLANPSSPQFIDRYSPGNGYGLWYEDLYHSAQITDQIGYFISIFNDLEITDLSDPSDPKILSTYESNLKQVRAEPPYVYTISSDFGIDSVKHRLVTLDASNLFTPTVESKYLITDTIWIDVIGGFDVSGGIAYIGLPKEVQVVDIRDPKHPALLSKLTWDTWSTPTTIEADGSLALIARDGTIEVVDVSQPVSPTIVGSITTGGHPSAIQIIGDLAYVACRETGAQVIDLSDPANPKLVKQYYGNTASIQTSPGYPVYLANQSDGLQIYKPYPLAARR